MKDRRMWYLVPTALFPYVILGALTLTLFSSENSVFEFIMVSLFNSNIWNLAFILLLYCIAAIVCNLIFSLDGVNKARDTLSLAMTAMLIKLIQVPAYVMIFVFGVLLMITPFTIPFTLVLFLLDCLTLVLSGLVTTVAVVNAVRRGAIKLNEAILFVLLQLIFCADVVASILLYKKVKVNLKSEC